MAYDLSKFTNIINLINDARCKLCRIDYDEKWCNHTCFFCIHFNPWRDAYSTIVKEMYWYYIKSGEEYNEYCISYLDNLKKWYNTFNKFTKEDEKYEYYIRSTLVSN